MLHMRNYTYLRLLCLALANASITSRTVRSRIHWQRARFGHSAEQPLHGGNFVAGCGVPTFNGPLSGFRGFIGRDIDPLFKSNHGYIPFSHLLKEMIPIHILTHRNVAIGDNLESNIMLLLYHTQK